ncbi:UvrD-helicase domain-containing protein [Nocardia sp. NPDC005978]|uniref:UvrD-helicase domain-containing protein n=1 Tax=Nocardia sp. NPDC005978 TaxID=3156725 RepID=UPI0033B8B16F
MEQQAAIDAFASGADMAIQAGAGTGKTTTLRLLSNGSSRAGLYLAYNRAVAAEAQQRFVRTVQCRTAHSMAYRAVGHHYRERLNAARVSSAKVGAALGIRYPLRIGNRPVSAAALSYTTVRTVQRFCYSADREIMSRHVPRLRGLDDVSDHQRLIDVVLPYAVKAWGDLQHRDRGSVRFDHDHYLKMWALGEPELDYDFILLDEAQDTNPVVEQVFNAQRSHSQLVMVGDSAQAIYGWRGAQDVMYDFDGTQLGLTRSFRFGAAVAAEANRWLAIVDAPIRLTGNDGLATEICDVEQADVVLCRTNVGAMLEVMSHLSRKRRVALVGGGKSLELLARAARDLQGGRRSNHPELCLFTSWGELQDYAENDPAGADLGPLVSLIDDYGVDVVLEAVANLCGEAHAEVTISTAHKAKGREWDTVRIGDDFAHPENPECPGPVPIGQTEAKLAYVAVTRARLRLDLGGLKWIEAHPEGRPGSVRPSVPEVLPGEDRTCGSGLFVDLVPETCWFTNVRSCVDGKDWLRLQRMVNARAGHRCEVCGRDRDGAARRWLEAHERWVFDDATGVQHLRRIILLCTDCHQTTHFGFAQVSGRASHAFDHLRSVTGMSEAQARQHVAEAFALWQVRSVREWTLDLTILTDAGIGLAEPPSPAHRAAIAEQRLTTRD